MSGLHRADAAETVAIGIRVKTGRATAIVLGEPVANPRVVGRYHLLLHDESEPDSFQPYHAALDHSAKEAKAIIDRLSTVVREASRTSFRDLIEDLRRASKAAVGTGIVVSSLTDPSTIRNPHMHAHGAEGRLFFEAVEEAVKSCGLPCATFVEKELWKGAAETLGSTVSVLQRTVTEMRKTAGSLVDISEHYQTQTWSEGTRSDPRRRSDRKMR